MFRRHESLVSLLVKSFICKILKHLCNTYYSLMTICGQVVMQLKNARLSTDFYVKASAATFMFKCLLSLFSYTLLH